jgi:hypothetical protein
LKTTPSPQRVIRVRSWNAISHPGFDVMIAIYEPIYMPGQSLSEPAFQPLTIENSDRAEWREFYILVDMYRRGLHRQQLFTGLMSPKFRLKTKITGTQFIDFVRANADADVCFINPFAHLAYICFNVWMQGEASHPGLVLRAQELLDASGIDLRITDVPRHGPAVLCFCNFWVGTEKFWDDYVGGILIPIAEFLEKNPDHSTSRSVLATARYTEPVPFLPFIVERLFSTFLSRPSRKIIARAYPPDPVRSCLNEFEKKIVAHRKEVIDAADRQDIFPDPLRRDMGFICELWQAYNIAYYTDHPHPHTGACFPPEIEQ